MTFVCLSGRAAASRVSALKPLVSASVRGGEGVGLGGGLTNSCPGLFISII